MTPTSDTENEERARRLESDAEAVQVITIHRSKGLEFPVVFCPYMWDGRPYSSDVPMFHDPDNGNLRTIDVGREGNSFAVHQKMELEEGRGEDLRLLYVALTRAQHQAVLWWAGAMDSQHSPLARLLFDRDDHGVVGPYGAALRTDEAVEAARRRRWGPAVSVERVDPALRRPVASGRGRSHRTSRPRSSIVALDVGLAPRVVLEHHPGAARAAVDRERAGAPAHVRRGGDCRSGRRARESGRRRSPAVRGAADWPPCPAARSWARWCTACWSTPSSTRRTWRPRWPPRSHERSMWRNVDLGSTRCRCRRAVCGHRVPARTRWSTTSGSATSPRRDRLDELGFEIPLVGGDAPTGILHVGRVADLLEEHLAGGRSGGAATPDGCGTRRSTASCVAI